MPQCAIIAGTGAVRLFQDMLPQGKTKTSYGEVEIFTSEDLDPEVPIILRHGLGHEIPPHLVNYRANISAIAKRGVERIISLGAVGSLRSSLRPEDIVLPDQFLDFTKSRPVTFVEKLEGSNGHVDITNPFCSQMRRMMIDSAKVLEIPVHPRAVYVCTEGPRYETAAEIRMFKMLGGDLVGMTCVPEVTLAREKGICYLHVSVVTNMAAGLKGNRISHRSVERIVGNKIVQLRKLLRQVVQDARDSERKCECGEPAV